MFFFLKFAEEGDNLVNNSNIYIVEGYNRKCVENSGLFSVRFRDFIFYTGNYCVVFCKKHSSYKHLRVVSV